MTPLLNTFLLKYWPRHFAPMGTMELSTEATWHGLNVALFDCNVAELINCGLYETNAIQFKFDQCNNPYFIRKHYEELQKQPAEVPQDRPPSIPEA